MLDSLLTTSNLALSGAILAVITTAKRSFPKLSKKGWAQRVMPVLPLLLGVAGGLLGATDATELQEKVTIGLVCGFFAANVYKVGRTSVLGVGIERPEPTEKPEAKKNDASKKE